MLKSQKLQKQSRVGETICAAGGICSQKQGIHRHRSGEVCSSPVHLCSVASPSHKIGHSSGLPQGLVHAHQVKWNVGLRAVLGVLSEVLGVSSWFGEEGEERPATMLNKASSSLLTMVKDWLRYFFLLDILEGKNIYHPLQHTQAIRKKGIQLVDSRCIVLRYK